MIKGCSVYSALPRYTARSRLQWRIEMQRWNFTEMRPCAKLINLFYLAGIGLDSKHGTVISFRFHHVPFGRLIALIREFTKSLRHLFLFFFCFCFFVHA